jgi:inorganic phosphate transporter, PiT family
MTANHSGLPWAAVRNLVLTLPVAMMLSGFLFFAFRRMF